MRYRVFARWVPTPFPYTGSLLYRCGAFDGRSMTLKEQWFENFVNEEQARKDLSWDLNEWERRKDHEEKAILLYEELGENWMAFATRMETLDQQEYEYQCQRDKQKAENLDRNNASWLSWARLPEEEKRKAAEEAKEQARVKSNFAAQVKARTQASEDLVTHSEIVTNAAGSQPPTQQSKLKQSKPEKHGKVSHSVSSTGAGPSKQQVRKPGLSKEEVCRQLREKVQATLPATTKKPATPTPTANVRSAPLRTDTLTPLRVETVNVAVISAGEEPFKAELAGGYYPQMGILPTTHYPKGAKLIKNGPGLPMPHLANSNLAKRRLLRNNGQGCNAVRNHTVSESTEQSSTGSSTQQNSSEESTPPSSVRVAPSETRIEDALDALSISSVGLTNDDHNQGVDRVRLLQLLRPDLYGEMSYPAQWDMMSPSTRRDPLLSTPSSANALSV